MTQTVDADIVILGGGVAGLWLLNRLRQQGFSAILLESGTLGGEQTHKAQGILHGGMKYALQGILTPAVQGVANAPALWRDCLEGKGILDLRRVPVLSSDQSLWTTSSMLSRASGFVASKTLRSAVRPLEREDFPDLFRHPDFKGDVYAFNEQVIDVHGLLRELVRQHQDAIFRIDPPRSTDIHYLPSGEIESITIGALPMPSVTLRARRFVFAAGSGNDLLLEKSGNRAIQMQLRPLQMVMAKHAFPHDLYAHCLGSGATPRLTITTHATQDGKKIWYIGGQLAEEGALRTPEEQQAKARSELQTLFPWLDFSTVTFASFYVDRAEARQSGLTRPDSFSVESAANYIVVWPTKLVLAPLLAEHVLETLKEPSIRSGKADLRALCSWPVPAFATPMWEQLFR